jgi:hypothetical protein
MDTDFEGGGGGELIPYFSLDILATNMQLNTYIYLFLLLPLGA